MTASTDASCVIHLVRHGQTLMNADVRFRGRRDVPLNRVGRREAIMAGRTLAGANLDAVYASPLGRALEVGTALAAAAGLDDVIEVEDLVNLDYGRWEGLTAAQSAEVDPAAWQAYLTDPEHATCPAGESLAAAADRVVNGLRELGARHPGGNVAAVSHGVMLRLAVLRVHGRTEPDWQFRISTGGSLVFTVRDGIVRLASHVPAGSRTDSLPKATSA
ncbi:MAG: alpha-ribazole phosphatase [Thermoleophilia bacterium]|nr:alpha-ribazole phosphatase [Thermoleophilia bacterium]MCZ4495595.1 alpha-ribazole phosphatase [Thermoleophilia bacterium]